MDDLTHKVFYIEPNYIIVETFTLYIEKKNYVGTSFNPALIIIKKEKLKTNTLMKIQYNIGY